jgi:microcompartment protein CcmL/EutN
VVEAIGLLEVQSIACGIDVADAMLKAAPVDFIDTFMATPGKLLVLVHGDPSSVESSVRAGITAAGAERLDSLILPFLDPQVLKAIRLQAEVQEVAAIGVIETSTVASGVLAADAAAKAAAVRLLALHLARGIGGKSVLTMTGALHDVQASIDAGSAAAAAASLLVATRIIANPHPDLAARVLASSRPALAV